MRQVYRSIYFKIFSSWKSEMFALERGISWSPFYIVDRQIGSAIFFYFQLNSKLCCTAVNQNSARAVVDGCLSNLSY